MIQSVITYLNAKLTLTGYFDSIYELSELVKNATGKTAPKAYCTNGEYKDLSNYDYTYGQSYWRKSGDVSLSVDDTQRIGSQTAIAFRIPLKLVCFIPKSKLSVDDAYSDERVAQAIIKQITTSNTGLRSLIKAKKITITPSRYTTDNQAILNTEYSGYKIPDIRYKNAYLSIDLEIEITATKDCINTECEIDSDILHIFDFCDASILARLTDAQRACLVTAFGMFDSPVVYKSNGTTVVATLGSGENYSIPKHNILNSVGDLVVTEEFNVNYTTPNVKIKTSDGSTTVYTKEAGNDQNIPTRTTFKSDGVTAYGADEFNAANRTIPAVTITTSEGGTVTKDGGDTYTCTAALARVYAWPAPTGQLVSYHTRDAVWVLLNYFNSLAKGAVTPLTTFYILAENNSFGNTARFTNATGQYFSNTIPSAYINGDLKNANGTTVSAATYANALTTYGSYTIDHYTGLGWWTAEQATATLANAITASIAATFGGFTNWFVPSTTIIDTIKNKSASELTPFSEFNYVPMSPAATSNLKWTSSTLSNTTTFAFHTTTDGRFLYQAKSTSSPYLLCHKHF